MLIHKSHYIHEETIDYSFKQQTTVSNITFSNEVINSNNTLLSLFDMTEVNKCFFIDSIDCMRIYGDDRKIMTSFNNDSSLKIPLQLHLLWKTQQIPISRFSLIKTWVTHYPNMTIYLWTDNDIKLFIKIFLQKHDKNLYHYLNENFIVNFTEEEGRAPWISLVDFMRIIILYYFGGIYADIDVSLINDITPLLKSHNCFVARELEQFPISMGWYMPVVASNAIMACQAQHDFLKFAINEIKTHNVLQPLTFAGPIGLTESLSKYANHGNKNHQSSQRVFIAPSIYMFPPIHSDGMKMHVDELRKTCRNEIRGDVERFFELMCKYYNQYKQFDWTLPLTHNRYFVGNYSFTYHHNINTWVEEVDEKSNDLH